MRNVSVFKTVILRKITTSSAGSGSWRILGSLRLGWADAIQVRKNDRFWSRDGAELEGQATSTSDATGRQEK